MQILKIGKSVKQEFYLIFFTFVVYGMTFVLNFGLIWMERFRLENLQMSKKQVFEIVKRCKILSGRALKFFTLPHKTGKNKK